MQVQHTAARRGMLGEEKGGFKFFWETISEIKIDML